MICESYIEESNGVRIGCQMQADHTGDHHAKIGATGYVWPDPDGTARDRDIARLNGADRMARRGVATSNLGPSAEAYEQALTDVETLARSMADRLRSQLADTTRRDHLADLRSGIEEQEKTIATIAIIRDLANAGR